ncbi:hypothetical protein RQP46_007492 [Phenoliferia psychrophenolica]
MLHRSSSKRIPQKAPTLPASAVASHPATPPTDPAPVGGTRPTDVLINRLHEVKRITKSLAAYFEAIASTHSSQAKSLLSVADGKTIQSPLPEAAIFLPSPVKEGEQVGWAEILAKVRDNTRVSAEDQSVLAREIHEGVVTPLKKLVSPLLETSVSVLTDLNKAIASFQVSPLELPSVEDPFIVRARVEAQLREQVTRENELLVMALRWQDKAHEVEVAVFKEVARCWAVYEEAHAKMLNSTQQRSSALHTTVASVSPETEWSHFQELNYLIPPTTPARDLSQITFPGQDNPATLPIMEGVLERKKRFVRNWKEAFFVLTPAGYLHEYRSAASPQSAPYLSLSLPHATLGPLPAPGTSSGGRMKEPKFVIAGRESEKGGMGSSVRGTMNIKKKELERVYKGRSWEAVKEWWEAIEKVIGDLQGPGPTAVQKAGIVPVAEESPSDEDIEAGSSDEEEAFEEARTSVPTELSTEEKPAYEATPGVLSGAERDLKVKSGIPAASGPEVPPASNLQARASTSKRKVEDTTGLPVATPSPTPAPTTNPTPAVAFAAPTPIPVGAATTAHAKDASVKLGTVEAGSPTMTDSHPNGENGTVKKHRSFLGFGKKKK